MIGSDDPQFKRIHHNFHHVVLYIKDFIMKEQCKNYLEIGTHYGHSFSNMLQSKYKTKFLGIDIFKRWADSKIDNMEKITIVQDDDGEKEGTFSKKYDKLVMAKLDEIVDWINSQG